MTTDYDDDHEQDARWARLTLAGALADPAEARYEIEPPDCTRCGDTGVEREGYPDAARCGGCRVLPCDTAGHEGADVCIHCREMLRGSS